MDLPPERRKDQTLTLPTQKRCPQYLSILIVLILINFWFSFLFINSFHFCVSSPKTDLYCIYGRTGSRFSPPQEIDPVAGATPLVPGRHRKEGPFDHHAALTSTALQKQVQKTNLREGSANTNVSREEKVHAGEVDVVKVTEGEDNSVHGEEDRIVKVIDEGAGEDPTRIVEQHVLALRSSATKGTKVTTPRSCDGKGIYVYDLPSKFNRDILAQCNDLIPWIDLCEHLAGDALGLPIPQLGNKWYDTHEYALEPIFHGRALNHPCRVYDDNEAKLFYVPFYGGLDVSRWHFKNVSSDVKDALGAELARWLEAQPAWGRSSGKDHMFVLGKATWDFRRSEGTSWGSNFLLLPQMQQTHKFLIERHLWMSNEIGVPHPTGFHPHDDGDIVAWQWRVVTSGRKNLVTFAGARKDHSNDDTDAESIRSTLIKQCLASGGHCQLLETDGGGLGPEKAVATFLESEFCLQPPGDSPMLKSVFESLVSGCIPVFFSPLTAYYQYPWHLPEDRRKYSVFIEEEEVKQRKVDVVEGLKMVDAKEREEMRKYIAFEVLPGLVYGDSTAKFEKFRDAFDMVMDNLIEKVSIIE